MKLPVSSSVVLLVVKSFLICFPQIIISTCQTEHFTVYRDAISLWQCSQLPTQRNLFRSFFTSQSF